MSRPRPLSGFPEFLPAGRIVEQSVLDVLRRTFELHGFGSIETRAVEPLEQLTRKGEIDKEVYVVRRLHAEEGAVDELGLHFDLTVPFARYVLENAGQLAFPFRRYQTQKVWRGERPQEGRYREFTQADIDVVGNGTLADHHDIEIALVAVEAFARLHHDLGLPRIQLQVNDRRLAEGFYRGLGIDDTAAVLQRIDKLDKLGPVAVGELLSAELGLSAVQVDACLRLSGLQATDASFADRVLAIGVDDPLLNEGLAKLTALIEATSVLAPGQVRANLKIARGLDYYTGTVYETTMLGHELLGSVGSGGRYESLATDGKQSYPGVGFSFGVSRLLAPAIGRGELTASRSVPSAVLVALDREDSRPAATRVASALRSRGVACEVAPKADKFGKQIRHAERRGIPFVWFGPGERDEVKDIRTGEQNEADPESWLPPEADRRPRVVSPRD